MDTVRFMAQNHISNNKIQAITDLIKKWMKELSDDDEEHCNKEKPKKKRMMFDDEDLDQEEEKQTDWKG
jgi:hypothetical protein